MWRKRGNKIPFIILLIIHTSLLLFTFIKKKDRKTQLALLLSNIGFAYLFEYIVLNLFQAYIYKPKILKNKYMDNILGAVLSQAIYIPFTAQFISRFHLKWKTKLFMIIYFQIVEKVFLKLRVYQTIWWSPVLTSIFLPVSFTLSDKWYEYLKKQNAFVRFISLFLGILIINVNLQFITAYKGIVIFGRGAWKTWREHFVYAPLYSIVKSIGGVYFALHPNRWFGRVGYVSFTFVVKFVFRKMGLIKRHLMSTIVDACFQLSIFTLFEKYKKLIYHGIEEEHASIEQAAKKGVRDKSH